jgi:hypothetical protein
MSLKRAGEFNEVDGAASTSRGCSGHNEPYAASKTLPSSTRKRHTSMETRVSHRRRA